MRRLALLVLVSLLGCHPDPKPTDAPALPSADVETPANEGAEPNPSTADPVVAPQPDAAALRSAAKAAATAAGLVPKKTRGPGPVIGGPQAGRKRIKSRWDSMKMRGKPQLVDFNRLYVSRAPWAEITPAGEFILRWSTEEPTQPASLYIGMRVEEDPRIGPRYRTHTVETQRRPGRKHEIRVSLTKFLGPRYDVNGIAERGYGEVAWQLEGYDSRRGSTVLIEGRTAFGVKGGKLTQQPTVVLGPLVHQVSDKGFIVSFETDVPTTAAVGVGRALPTLEREASTRHEVEIKGLEAGRHYGVQVAVSDGALTSVTPPRVVRTRAGTGPVVVALMSDSRSGPGPGQISYAGVNAAVLRPLFLSAYHRGAEAIFFPGDLIDGYSTHPDEFDWQLRSWLHVVEPIHAELPVYTGMGNHEALTDLWSGADWVQLDRDGDLSAESHFAALMVNPKGAPAPESSGAPTYEEAVYSVDLGPAHFVMLNTNYWYVNKPGHALAGGKGNREGLLMENQLQWLEKDLAKARQAGAKHIVVMGHEPAFPVGGHTKDAMWWFGKVEQVNQTRERFWKLLAEHGVVAYVSGDEHNYARALIGPETVKGAKGSVYSIITGGCGAPYYAQATPPEYEARVQTFSSQQHYTLWTFDDQDAPRLQVIGVSGEVIEDVRLTGADG